jgi:hypothetical protein
VEPVVISVCDGAVTGAPVYAAALDLDPSPVSIAIASLLWFNYFLYF